MASAGDVFYDRWVQDPWGEHGTTWGNHSEEQRLREIIHTLEIKVRTLQEDVHSAQTMLVYKEQEAHDTLVAVKAAHLAHQEGLQEELRLERVKVLQLEAERDSLLQAMSTLGVEGVGKQQQGE